jgi:inorganic triphosphatase YgiF
MNQEIELKLEVAPDAGARLMRQPWMEEAPRRSQRQISVYYDTADSELRGRGYSLRVRSAGDRYIQTVKSLDAGAGLFERGEWEYQIDGPAPDAEKLWSTPLAGLNVEELRAVIRSDVQRTACRLRRDGAEIEIDLDEGTMTAAGRRVPVHEIEIELLRGDASSAIALARRIANDVPVKLGVMSKAERGFALADGALGRVTKAEPVPVRPGMTVAQGFATIVGSCIRQFRLNEPLVIEQRTPEALHQARVAMRRLRSALTLFRTVVADEEYERIRDELRWFTGELGDARNLDVYLKRDLLPAEHVRLSERREAAYDRVISALDSPRLRTLMLDLVAWAALGQWRHRAEAAGPIEPYVNRRIDRLWGRVSGARHLAELDDEQRHRLRIQIKKLRYAVEFAAALHAHERQRQKKFAHAVEELQESLGHLHDLVVARSLVAAESWPIEPDAPSADERHHVDEAGHSIDRLRKIGAYWRSSED